MRYRATAFAFIGAVVIASCSRIQSTHTKVVSPTDQRQPPWYRAAPTGNADEFSISFPADTNGDTIDSIVFSVDTGGLHCQRKSCDGGNQFFCQDEIEVENVSSQKIFMNTFGDNGFEIVQTTTDGTQDDGEKFSYSQQSDGFAAAKAAVLAGTLTVQIHPSVAGKYDGGPDHYQPYTLYWIEVMVTHSSTTKR